MVAVVRVVLLILLAAALVTLLAGIFSGTTGALEKVVLAAAGVLVLVTAPRVQSIGHRRPR